MLSSSPKFWLIIPAAGIGTRMNIDRPKQYLSIADKTILEHTLYCFLEHPAFETAYVGLSPEDDYFECLPIAQDAQVKTYIGGSERSDTVLKGLEFIRSMASPEDWVWVHDSARPCLSTEELDRLIAALDGQSSGAVLGVPVSDTLKRVGEGSQQLHISKTVNREGLWRAMTPQVFKYGELVDALEFCQHGEFQVTDEASAIEIFGKPARMVQGSAQNIKATLPDDLSTVQDYLAKKARSFHLKRDLKPLKQNQLNYPRIGSGYDVHAFTEGDFITLGGVRIPHTQALLAHSDGDVLLHAIMDALLGALALGDIGSHFPDTDDKWKDADSRVLLRAVHEKILAQGYQVGNLDSTIIAQAPKMSPFIEQMQAAISEDLSISKDRVSVKATTTEKLGFTGRKEGIACQATAMLLPLESGDSA